MAIPNFNKRGVLPRGLHRCTPQEFLARFCYHTNSKTEWGGVNNTRLAYQPILEQLFGHSIQRGAKAIIFAGSFITAKISPGDIDCLVIVPNEKSIPHKVENIFLSDCKLDIIYAKEDNKKQIYSLMNMFSLDRYDLDVGLVEVALEENFKSSWEDFMSDLDFSELLKERETYIHRHCLIGNQKKGVLITLHGINSYAKWNFDLAPIASSNNWIFAPFDYGYVTTALLSAHKTKEIIENFRLWVHNVNAKYDMDICVIAHSFGTYILGKYIADFNYKPPVIFNNLVLAGSILNTKFDWISAINSKSVNSVLNIVSPNDPYVPLIKAVKWIYNDKLYGTAGVDGFEQTHSKLLSEKISIYDHSNMLRKDIFDTNIIPYLNLLHSFKGFSDFEFIPDEYWKNV